jgi:hypothetical protein
MKKRIVRLTESDLERLVTRIIKEESKGKIIKEQGGGDASLSGLRQMFLDLKKTIGQEGLVKKERETLMNFTKSLIEYFSLPGNQDVGMIGTRMDQVLKMMKSVVDKKGKGGEAGAQAGAEIPDSAFEK